MSLGNIVRGPKTQKKTLTLLTGCKKYLSLSFTPFWAKTLRRDLNFPDNRKSHDRKLFTVSKGF